MQMVTETNYNTIAEKFIKHKKNFAHTDFIGLEFIRSQLGEILKGKEILDYGCGNGNNALWFANAGASVFGVDISKTLLDDAKHIGNDNIKFINLSDDFLFPKNNFDGAYSTYVTCVIPTQEKIVDIFLTIYSTLKPGAKFFLMNTNREKFNGKRDNGFKCIYTDNLSEGAPITTLLQYKEGDDDSCFIPVKDYFYSKKKYIEMLESSGFILQKITTSELFQAKNCGHKTFDETTHSPIFVITAEK